MSERELPTGWAWAKVGELAANEPNALTIGPFGSDLRATDYASAGVPLVFVREIRAGRFGDERTKFISHQKAELLQRHMVRPGDLLVTKMGDPPGDTAVYPGDAVPAIITADCIKMTVGAGSTASFLLHWLRTDPSREALLAETQGVAQQKLSLERFRMVRLPVPPLDEQRRIVAKLDKLLARSRRAREALAEVPALVARYRESVLAAAFRGDLTADWREAHPAVESASALLERIRVERRRRWEEAELAKLTAKGKAPKDDRWKERYEEPAQIADAALPSVPRGWAWTSIEELVDPLNPLCYGVVQPGEHVADGVPLVRVMDLADGTVLVDQLRRITVEVDREYDRSRLAGGEVLVSVVGTIGRTAIAPQALRGANIARAIARISPVSELHARWIATWLSCSFMRDWLTTSAVEVARQTLNLGVLATAPIPLAPDAELTEVLDRIERASAPMRASADVIPDVSARLDAYDRSLLARAFAGELVPQDPNDEPASALLARLRAERDNVPRGGGRRRRG